MMKKIFAILMTACLLAGLLCVAAFAAEEPADAPAPGVVLRISGERKNLTIVKIADHTSFEDGWNAAMKLAKDGDKLKEDGYTRIVVDIYTDWDADKDGNFTDDTWNGAGFDNDTIFIPADAKVTLNLNGHSIDRGLTKDRNDGEVMFINDDADVIINNGTITGGYSNSEGGGLYIEGARVTLNDVHIVGNRVHHDDGAGIYAGSGTVLTVNGGSFENNVQSEPHAVCYGGAIYIAGSTASFNDVVFKNNKSKSWGAAIYADECTVALERCAFEGNEASYSTLHLDDCLLEANNTTFKGNKCRGVIEADGSTMLIDKCVFTGNTAKSINLAFSASFQITNSEFTDNSSCVMSTGNFSISNRIENFFKNCTFNNNGSTYGAFYDDFSDIVFYDCDFGNSKFNEAENMVIKYSDLSREEVKISVTVINKDGTEETTGYMFLDFGWDYAMRSTLASRTKQVVIDLLADWNATNGVFGTYNSGFEADTIYIPADANVTFNLNGHTINRGLDKAISDGEVICIGAGAHVTINGGTVTGGYSDSGAGGIHVKAGANVTLNDVDIVGNKVEDDDGVGIALYDRATLTMNGGSISNNLSIRDDSWEPVYGGGIYAYMSTATLTGVTLKNNRCESKYSDMMYGSAVYSTESTVKLTDCTVESNGVTKDDASYFCTSTIYAENSTLTIKNTSFIGNGAKNDWQASDFYPYSGSAVIYAEDTKLTLKDGSFTDNKQVFLISLWDTAVAVNGVDFTDNESFALYVQGASSTPGTFANCKFSAGTAYEDFHHDFLFNDEKAGITFTDCDFGKATFSNKDAVTFVGGTVSNNVASMFGEGSTTIIFSILALVAAVSSIFLTVYYNKKKSAPVAPGNEDTDDEE